MIEPVGGETILKLTMSAPRCSYTFAQSKKEIKQTIQIKTSVLINTVRILSAPFKRVRVLE